MKRDLEEFMSPRGLDEDNLEERLLSEVYFNLPTKYENYTNRTKHVNQLA